MTTEPPADTKPPPGHPLDLRSSMAGPRFEVLSGEIALDAITDADWEAVETSGGTPFSSREWIDSWSSQRPGDFSDWLSVRCWTADGEVVTWLFAVTVNSQRVRAARLAGFGFSEEMGPIGPTGAQLEAAHILNRAIEERALPVDVVILDQLRGDIAWGEAFGRPPVKDASNVLLDTSARDFEAWLLEEPRRSNRYRVRLRKLDAAGGRVRRARAGAEAREVFADVLDLHEARWGRTGLLTPHFVAMHSRFIERAAERDWLRLWSVEIGSKPVAALYGLSFGGTTYLLQTARDPDPAYRRLSLGTVLIMEAIRDAFDEGNREVALMHYFYEYKARFSDGDRRVQGYWLPANLRGRLFLIAKRARMALARRSEKPV